MQTIYAPCMVLFLQRSFGVTCWEILTCGKILYPGVDPSELPKFLERGRRLEKHDDAACAKTMIVHTQTHTHTHTHTHTLKQYQHACALLSTGIHSVMFENLGYLIKEQIDVKVLGFRP